MTIRNNSWHLALATAVLALAPASSVTARPSGLPAVTPQVDATNPVASVDPRVPRAAGQPCVVELLHDRPWPQLGVEAEIDPTVTYTPPRACPPPWSKVILKIDMDSNSRSTMDTLGMDLARVRLFRMAVPHYDDLSRWHVERDLTDYSALFKAPRTGLIWSTRNPSTPLGFAIRSRLTIFQASAKLLFYPSTAATPAPRVPDAIIGVNQDMPVNLPHNVVRAYLDVENAFPSRDLIWYACWTDDSTNVQLDDYLNPGTNPKDAISPPAQGCGGGSFREVRVRVDGTLAGIAPGFPLVIADLNWWYFRNSANLPIPTLEMLNAKPYRIDLSPFAAILSAPGPHNVVTNNPSLNEDTGERPGGATLLLYLDRHRSQVTGAVTLNTLATQNGKPTDINTLTQSGNSVRGDIRLRQHRDFIIRGFVDTSRGRIDASVHQTGDFSTLQKYHLEGQGLPEEYNTPVEKLYVEDVWLANSAVQTSRRSQGSRLISWDQVSTRYPLRLTWHVASTGEIVESLEFDIHRTNITVLQSRVVDGDHYKPGFGHYTTHAGARFYSSRKGGDEQTDPRWESYTTRNYRDNFGSCYHGELGSRDGAIVHRSLGDTCPDGRNRVRWFAHPDGSPYTLGWWR